RGLAGTRLLETRLGWADRRGLDRSEVEILVEERGCDRSERRPEVPDPAVAPHVLHELRPESPSRIHGRPRERPAHEDVERDREADRKAGDRLEGPPGIGSRGEDHPDEEEGEDGLDHEPLTAADTRTQHGRA